MEKKSKISIDTRCKKELNIIVYPTDLKRPNEGDRTCTDCYAEINVPHDIVMGEIVSCPGCGRELETKKINDKGRDGKYVTLQELTIEGEDWGE
jgi:alpha-aminoadipate/glutamate carrier protein LysW